MIRSLKARWMLIFAVFLVTVINMLPNFIDTNKHWWFTNAKMIMGLDIQGGSHLVLRVDTESVFKQETNRNVSDLERHLSQKGVVTQSIKVLDPLIGALRLEVADATMRENLEKVLRDDYGNTYQIGDKGDNFLVVQHSEVNMHERQKNMVEQAIETIRNRIDEFGVAEPSITAQGADRILVQLPGIQDASQAKELIKKTAKLDFMLVDTSKNSAELAELIKEAEKEGNFKLEGMKYTAYVDKLNEVLKSKLPPKTVVMFGKTDRAQTIEAERIPYLLKQDEAMGGEHLTNAYMSQGELGSPAVSFSFDRDGTRQFAELTKRNVGRQFAIVLDKVVKSAPNIKEPITQGQGQISLGQSDRNKAVEEAKLIVMVLRSGALPAPLEQLEERTVGPSLGRDAIDKGQRAAILSALIVFLFMGVFYRGFGMVANICLTFNIMIVIAILSSLKATLTLPGIAGMALTIGVAVDANVIIYERVKEEMRKGASALMALREGYDRAFSSILDANLTTLAVCLILMYYGTGPVRGFAVTLVTGLSASMFTAIFFTRALLETMMGVWKWDIKVSWGQGTPSSSSSVSSKVSRS